MRFILLLTSLLLGLPLFARAGEEQALAFFLGATGVETRDVSAGANERVVAVLPLPGPLFDLRFYDNRVYVARGHSGITVIDVRDALHPVELFTFGSDGAAMRLQMEGVALVAENEHGFKVAYDLSQRDNPRRLPLELPAQPLSALGWPHVASDRERSAYGKVIAGAILLGTGIFFGLLSGVLFDASRRAANAAEQRHEYFSLDGLPEAVFGSGFLGVAIIHTVVGIPLIAVGKYQLRREIRLHPNIVSAPGSAMTPQGILLGANLGMRF